jgi:hypothetical protein
MKTRSIGVLGATSFATVASMFVASSASAQVLGLTATSRLQTDGNYLVNVWAVAGSSTNALTSVSGGQIGSITTNAVGGFRQGAGTGQGVWAPSGAQNWTTLDSFLTCGGGFLTSSGSWTGNSSTTGDPNWNVTYFDTDLEENQTANAFNTPSNASGFINPYINTVAPAGGWSLPGGTNSPARSLASLTALGRQNVSVAGQNAAAGTFGIMLAQFYVSGAKVGGGNSQVFFNNMRVFLGSTDNQLISSFTIEVVPAPGAVALLGLAGLAGRRRRA